MDWATPERLKFELTHHPKFQKYLEWKRSYPRVLEKFKELSLLCLKKNKKFGMWLISNRLRWEYWNELILKNKKGENKMKRPVLITTEFRGVFFGFVKNDKSLPDEMTLTNVRNCLYWSSDCGGFLGLAQNGPTKSCKIGTQVAEITLYKITSVTHVNDKAVKAWQEA